jgi:hypothetical protein
VGGAVPGLGGPVAEHWEHCTSSNLNCDIRQAVRTGPVWNVTVALAHSREAGYGSDGVSPDSGSTTTAFTYKAVYTERLAAGRDLSGPSVTAAIPEGTIVDDDY